MKEQKSFGELLESIIKDINMDTDKLYSDSSENKSDVLKRLKERATFLENLIGFINKNNILQINAIPQQYRETVAQSEVSDESNLKIFDSSDFSKYDGKNGNPAYVAVDGTVYDVTNNTRWWAAAIHFGITPGKDLTKEFYTCHKDVNILKKLPIVGKLK